MRSVCGAGICDGVACVQANHRRALQVLMLLSFILDENPDWGVGHVVDLDAIIAHAVSLFDEVCVCGRTCAKCAALGTYDSTLVTSMVIHLTMFHVIGCHTCAIDGHLSDNDACYGLYRPLLDP